MNARRHTARDTRRRITTMALLPLLIWSMGPAWAVAAEPCPVPDAPEAMAHGCCAGHEAMAVSTHAAMLHVEGMPHAPAATEAARHEPLETPLAGHSDAASCECLPAGDLPKAPADSATLTVNPAPSRIVSVSTHLAPYPFDPGPLLTRRILKCPDETRRRASAPPLFLLHDLLLI